MGRNEWHVWTHIDQQWDHEWVTRLSGKPRRSVLVLPTRDEFSFVSISTWAVTPVGCPLLCVKVSLLEKGAPQWSPQPTAQGQLKGTAQWRISGLRTAKRPPRRSSPPMEGDTYQNKALRMSWEGFTPCALLFMESRGWEKKILENVPMWRRVSPNPCESCACLLTRLIYFPRKKLMIFCSHSHL